MTAVTTAGLLAGLFGSAFVPAAYGARVGTSTAVPPKASLTLLTTGSALDDNAAGTAFGFLSDDADETLASANVVLKVAIHSAGNVNLATADLKAVSSNDDILVAWLYTNASGQSDGAVGLGETAAALDCADMDGTDGAGGNELAIDAFAATDIVESAPEHTATLGLYWLCIAAAEDDTAATSTITISAQEDGESATAGWVTLKTVTVTAIGPTDAITLSITNGYKYVAEENAALEGWLTILCRDENGTLINDATASISAGNSCGTVTEDSLNAKNADDTAIDFVDITTGEGGTGHAPTAPATGANAGSLRLYHLQDQTCNEETDEDLDDAGNSYSLKVAVGTVKSNAITITCTEDSAGASITKVTATDTVGPEAYDDGSGDDNNLEYIGTFVDEDGRPLGDGAGATDFGAFTFAGDADVVTELELNDPAGGAEGQVTVLGGEATLSHITDGFDFGRRGKFTIEITVSDSDLATTTAVEETFTLVYTVSASEDVTIAKTMAAGKRSATITVEFGEDSAYERVAFFVENSKGVVKEFVRRANADGVATFKLARRNATFYVFADLDAGGAPTDILEIKFK